MLSKQLENTIKEVLDGIIAAALAKMLLNMAGFRNIAVHDYQAIELDIIQFLQKYY